MTDKDTVATVASEAVRAIRGMNALLKDYSGTALAHLYELQETETIRLIVGAQPLIPPMPDGLLGTVAKLAMRQPFVLFKGLTFQKLCLPGAFRPGDHHNKMLRPGLCVVHASPQYL